MQASIDWLDDPQVFRVNQRKAHSDHTVYGSKEEIRSQSSRLQSLNGEWRFYFSENAEKRPKEFLNKILMIVHSTRSMCLATLN